jgi:hypothetical protein
VRGSTPMHSTQLGIGSGWQVARKPGKSGARRLASAYRTSHSFVVHIDSCARCAVPPRNRNAVLDTDGEKNHVAACGAPGEWPDVDFGALLQGQPCQSRCLLTLRDEALVLGLGEAAEAVSKQALLFEEFVAGDVKAGASRRNSIR